jgi:hypothetical protein
VQETPGHSGIQMTIDTYNYVATGIQEATAKRLNEIFYRTQAGELAKIIG